MTSTLIEIECLGVVGPDGRLELHPSSGYKLGPAAALHKRMGSVPYRTVTVSIVYEPLPPAKERERPAPEPEERPADEPPQEHKPAPVPPGLMKAYGSAGQIHAWHRGYADGLKGGEFENPYEDTRGGFRAASAAGWDAARDVAVITYLTHQRPGVQHSP